MIEISTAIRLYSDLNEQIDLVVLVGAHTDLEKVENIAVNAWNDWWDLEQHPELQQIPIGDYISSRLKEEEIETELYFKGTDAQEDVYL